MIEKFKETADFIKSKINIEPEVGIILGSGLGGVATKIEDATVIPYKEIPNFPVSTVEGHSGNLIIGKFGGKNVVAMQGRFHYYEGYGMKEVTFPVRVMHFLGVKYLIVSNAAGGLNPAFKVGTIMIITDHINFFPEHPLRGKNISELGVRFPDMSKVYDPELIKLGEQIAKEEGINNVEKGVYIGSSGPTLETQAEYKMFRTFGADATGMSTVPEVIVAHHQRMRVFGLSVITNPAVPAEDGETTHEEVQNVAGQVEPNMTKLITKLIERL